MSITLRDSKPARALPLTSYVQVNTPLAPCVAWIQGPGTLQLTCSIATVIISPPGKFGHRPFQLHGSRTVPQQAEAGGQNRHHLATIPGSSAHRRCGAPDAGSPRWAAALARKVRQVVTGEATHAQQGETRPCVAHQMVAIRAQVLGPQPPATDPVGTAEGAAAAAPARGWRARQPVPAGRCRATSPVPAPPQAGRCGHARTLDRGAGR